MRRWFKRAWIRLVSHRGMRVASLHAELVRQREISEAKSLAVEDFTEVLGRERIRSGELMANVRTLEEELKLRDLQIRNLIAENERNFERLRAETAVNIAMGNVQQLAK